MFFGPLEHLVVRRWLVFEIVRWNIIFPHRIIFKSVPHQDATKIGMPIEKNSVEIVNFAFLEFRAAINRRQGRDTHLVGAIGSALAKDDRSLLQRHRIEVRSEEHTSEL